MHPLTQLDRARAWIILFALVVSLPTLAVEFLPLVDYPNHLARQYVIAHHDHSEILQRYYEYDWKFIVAIAMDVFVQLFAHIAGLEWSMRLFAWAALLAPFAGALVLARVLHGTFYGPVIWSSLFVFSASYLYGFINFTLGVGVALALYAAWIATRDASPVWRTPGFTAAAIGLILIHGHAFGIYALLVAGFEISRKLGQWIGGRRFDFQEGVATLKEAAIASVHVLVPIALFFLLSPTSDRMAMVTDFEPGLKISYLINPMVFFSPAVELLLSAMFGAVLAAGVLTGRIGIRFDQILSVGFILLALVFLPFCIFGNCFADFRVPTPLAFAAMAVLRFKTPARHRQSLIALNAVVAVLLITRTAEIGREWTAAQAPIKAMEEALQQVPRGAKLLAIRDTHPMEPSGILDRSPGFWQWPVHAVTEREAFVSTLFGSKNHQGLSFRPGLPEHLTPIQHLDRKVVQGFDYVMITDQERLSIPPEVGCAVVATGPRFTLCRLGGGS